MCIAGQERCHPARMHRSRWCDPGEKCRISESGRRGYARKGMHATIHNANIIESRRGDSRLGGGWVSWEARDDPGSKVPDVRGEIHGEAGHGVVSPEEPLRTSMSSAGIDGRGSGYLHVGEGVWGRGRDDAEMVDASRGTR